MKLKNSIDTKANGIYRITNTVNNKHYIGSTVNTFHTRWTQHKSCLKRGGHPNPHLQHAWNKYGNAAFKFIILEIVDSADAVLEREQHWLDYYRATEIVYNIALYALSPMKGRRHTEESKQKTRDALGGEKHPFYGKNLSEEHCRNLSIAHQGNRNHNYGVPRLENTKQKIQSTLMGHKVSDITRQKISNALIGRTASEATKQKISAGLKGRKVSEETRRKIAVGVHRAAVIRKGENSNLEFDIDDIEG